jgi:hypothetical protein
MRAKGIPRSNERVQRALLALVLAEHPARVWFADLANEFGREGQLAIEALVSVGLLFHIDNVVIPSRAALHFERLESL